MNIKLNGENETLEKDSLTVTELLKVKEVKMPEMVFPLERTYTTTFKRSSISLLMVVIENLLRSQ